MYTLIVIGAAISAVMNIVTTNDRRNDSVTNIYYGIGPNRTTDYLSIGLRKTKEAANKKEYFHGNKSVYIQIYPEFLSGLNKPVVIISDLLIFVTAQLLA